MSKVNVVQLKSLTTDDIGKIIAVRGTFELKERESEEGTPYLNLRVKDGTGSIMYNFFASEDNAKHIDVLRSANPNSMIEIIGELKQPKQDDRTINFFGSIKRISEIISYQGETFNFENVRNYLKKVNRELSPEYKEFVSKLINKNYINFFTSPFSDKNYFAFRGGLACYTAKMLQLVDLLKDKIYLGDISLLRAIIFAHRIGKLETLSINENKAAEITFKGQLTEDTVYTVSMVKSILDSCEKLSVKEKDLLLHAVACTKNRATWGALTVPKLYEAKIVYMLEDMILAENEYKNLLTKANEEVLNSEFIKGSNQETFYIPINEKPTE